MTGIELLTIDVDEGGLTEEQEERIGMTLMLLDDRMATLRARYGVTAEDLNLDLGTQAGQEDRQERQEADQGRG